MKKVLILILSLFLLCVCTPTNKTTSGDTVRSVVVKTGDIKTNGKVYLIGYLSNGQPIYALEYFGRKFIVISKDCIVELK